MSQVIEPEVWVAIRRSPEHADWIDTNTINLLREMTVEKCKEIQNRIPEWHRLHPVKRIVKACIVVAE